MNSKSFLAVGICVLAMLFSVVNTSDAYTGGGAWGGGSLGFGGGAWGASRGGLGTPIRNLLANRPVRSLLANRPTPLQNLAANRPVRSLLGRVRDRVATAVGNIAALGAGSAGNFGCVGVGNGSWSGFNGIRSGGYGSGGYGSGGYGAGGYGSVGSVAWSAPSYGNVSSGIVGNSYVESGNIGGGHIVGESYIGGGHIAGGSYLGGGSVGGTISNVSAGNSFGFISAAPAYESMASFATDPVFESPVIASIPQTQYLLEGPSIGFAAPDIAMAAPMTSMPPIMPTFSGPINAGDPFNCAYCPQGMPIHPDGLPAGVVPGDLSGTTGGTGIGSSGIPVEGSTIPDGMDFNGSAPAGLDSYYDGVDPNSVLEGRDPAVPLLPSEGAGSGDFPMPSPTDGDTSIDRSERLREAVLNVALPLDAKVYVNEKLTKTPGQIRSYISRNLNRGRNYTYNLKVVAERDGKPVELHRKVVMRAGQKREIKFDFDTPMRTKVSLRVPANATVELAGNKTKSTKATLRHFETSLKPGQTWDDYKVIVIYEQGGKKVTREHTLNVVAGKQYVLDFHSEKSVNMFVSK